MNNARPDFLSAPAQSSAYDDPSNDEMPDAFIYDNEFFDSAFAPGSATSRLASDDGPLSDYAFTYREVGELSEGQRWSTWDDVQKGCHGPEPRPDWVLTDHAAIDTELGILKTGKEADVFLLERAIPGGPSSLLAAKRYRSTDHRDFHRDAGYVEGRRVRRSRDMRAMARGTTFGRQVAAGQWAAHEWAALCSLWSAGVPVPYPVQVDGTEILMEFIDLDGDAAPRLAQVRPSRNVVEGYFEQLREAMAVLARRHLAHGDLSPYNILAQGDRLVIIDLPQVVDIVGNPAGVDFLLRDCRNVCGWFVSRGLAVDPEELLAELLAQAW